MKSYGYDRDEWEATVDQDVEPPLRALREVSLVASSQQLRQVAKFINETADLMDEQGNEFDHSHFRDWSQHWHCSMSDLIICLPQVVDSADSY